MVERRPKRQATAKRAVASAAHYVGYVDDEESVTSIMKKFEELDRFTSALKTESQEGSDGEGKKEAGGLTQEQLEEVFKRTSMFSAKLLTTGGEVGDDMLLDEEEAWKGELYMRDRDSDEESVSWSDDAELWEDDELFERRKSHRARGTGQREPQAKRVRLSNHHMAMAGNMLAGGQRAAIKKRERTIDPRKPTYVRIPLAPLPLSWGHIIQPLQAESQRAPCAKYVECNILGSNLKQVVGGRPLCVLMDPPLLLPGEDPSPHKISIKQLEGLHLHTLVQSGFIFVWLEKELVPDMFALMNKWEFRYVENICWMQRGVDNRPALRPGTYVPKAKLTCFIFRKMGEIELRHQRNPDVIVDYVWPVTPTQGYHKQHRPTFVYDVIETLLPDAKCPCPNSPHAGRLVELYVPSGAPGRGGVGADGLCRWGTPGQSRDGWTTLVQTV